MSCMRPAYRCMDARSVEGRANTQCGDLRRAVRGRGREISMKASGDEHMQKHVYTQIYVNVKPDVYITQLFAVTIRVTVRHFWCLE